MIKRLEYYIKHNAVAQRLYVFMFSLVFRVIGLFVKKDSKQVIFQSLIGKSSGDSPRVLYDSMRKDKRFENFRFVWAFDNPDRFDIPGASKVKLNSPQYFLEALRSRIWITNVTIERGLKFKPKGTVYVNTWHGIPIKVIGNAQKNRNDYDYSNMDLVCCSSEFEKEIFVRDFKVRPEAIAKCGMPRNDELYYVTDDEVEALRKKHQIPDGKKVILYAPTWRDSADGGKTYQIAPPIDVAEWERRLGDEYVMLFRMHHLTTDMLGIEYNHFARDASKVEFINELLKIADVLVSDYSATIFDYAILERPIISFAYDLDEYAQARGFYEKLDDVLPGSVCRTADEVLDMLCAIDWATEREKTRRVKRKYLEAGGKATQVCLDYLCSRIDTE